MKEEENALSVFRNYPNYPGFLENNKKSYKNEQFSTKNCVLNLPNFRHT